MNKELKLCSDQFGNTLLMVDGIRGDEIILHLDNKLNVIVHHKAGRSVAIEQDNGHLYNDCQPSYVVIKDGIRKDTRA